MCTYSNGTNIDRDQNSEISELCMMIDKKIHHRVIIYINVLWGYNRGRAWDKNNIYCEKS